MSDVWVERCKVVTELFTKLGFPAMAFVSILASGVWYASRSLDHEADRITILQQKTDADIAVLLELTTTLKAQRTDLGNLLEFTKRVDTDHETQNAALTKLVEHFCGKDLVKNGVTMLPSGEP